MNTHSAVGSESPSSCGGVCSLARGKACGTASDCALRAKLWTAATSLALSLIKVVVGILGRSEALVADGLYSFYQSFVGARSILAGRRSAADAATGLEHPRSVWFMSLVAGFLVGAGALDVMIFSIWRLVRASQGLVMEPSPYALLVAAVSILVNYLLLQYSVGACRQADQVRMEELRGTFQMSMAYSGLVVVGVALGQWAPAADALAAVFGAALLVRPVISLCEKSAEAAPKAKAPPPGVAVL